MNDLPVDPFEDGGLEKFAKDFRAGTVTSTAVTQAYLERIAALDPKWGAFEYVSSDTALNTAKAMTCSFNLAPTLVH